MRDVYDPAFPEYEAFRNGERCPKPVPGEFQDEQIENLARYVDALADTVRDLATMVRLLTGDETYENVDVSALRERLAQIKPRDG